MPVMIIFALLALVTIAGAIAAMTLRNLVHCALALTVSFAGLAAVYLRLDAQFVGFAQLLIYVGAVAILIVFAILLTRSGESPAPAAVSRSAWFGIGVAVLVFGLLSMMILRSSAGHTQPAVKPEVSIGRLGEQLMTRYLLPLEVIGLLLTAALIGAVLIAWQEKEAK